MNKPTKITNRAAKHYTPREISANPFMEPTPLFPTEVECTALIQTTVKSLLPGFSDEAQTLMVVLADTHSPVLTGHFARCNQLVVSSSTTGAAIVVNIHEVAIAGNNKDTNSLWQACIDNGVFCPNFNNFGKTLIQFSLPDFSVNSNIYDSLDTIHVVERLNHGNHFTVEYLKDVVTQELLDAEFSAWVEEKKPPVGAHNVNAPGDIH